MIETKLKYVGKCLLLDSGKEKILVVGDLHLGFEEMLNKSGVLVSRQMFEEMISDLNNVFGEVGRVDKVVLLGDVKHDFGGILKQEWSDVNALLNYLESMAGEVVVVKGNHDNILEPILKKRKMRLWNCYIWREFAFLHGDKDFRKIWDKKIKYLIIGHGHPAVKLREKKGTKVEKYKCFLIGKFRGKEMIILPSFIDYYAGSDPREGDVILAWDVNFKNFNVKIVPVGPGELNALDFGKLKNLD
jgi:hypothetical protein